MRKTDISFLVRLCLPQFAVGLFTTMLNNYLIYFYQPSRESGIPELIPQGRIVLRILTVIGMIKAIGHIIDAVTVPFILPAGTDARRFTDLSDAVIRFVPIDIDAQQYASVHGENENISIDKIHLAVDFYKELLRKI